METGAIVAQAPDPQLTARCHNHVQIARAGQFQVCGGRQRTAGRVRMIESDHLLAGAASLPFDAEDRVSVDAVLLGRGCSVGEGDQCADLQTAEAGHPDQGAAAFQWQGGSGVAPDACDDSRWNGNRIQLHHFGL